MIEIKKEIAKLIAASGVELPLDEIEGMIETPQDKSMGDYAFPCFKLAKVMRKAPNMIAADVASRLAGSNDLLAEVKPVNAYVNMFISREGFVKEIVGSVIEAGENYGGSDIGKGKKVIVEYSSPNIAKPFHIGHIRTTVIGAALANIYEKLGYEVLRLNHLGDYGTQFGKMIVAYRLWGKKDDVEKDPIKTLVGYYVRFHKEAETNPELVEEARATFAKLEHGEKEEVELWQWFREESLKEFMRVYDMFGMKFDSYNGESFYSDKMDRFVKELADKGLLHESQGAQVVDLEEYGLGTALIKKSDGSTLYITRDIAAAVYRKEHYGFDKCIYVVASQQNLHFQQWIKILSLMGYEWADTCVHVPFGLISLEGGGTLSTREGNVVFLEDVLNSAVEKTREIIKEKGVATDNIDEVAEEVGIGAVVFQELSASRIKDYVFTWDKVLDFNGETGPYVQYTHARCASILRNAEEKGVTAIFDPKYIVSDSAYDLARLIYTMPNAVRSAADSNEPSIITRHIIDIAEAFNKFYHDEHILVDDEAERSAKVALVKATKIAIKSGLSLLGIKAPERM